MSLVKQEPEWAESEARAELYAGHEVKEELVLGPIQLQPRDAAYRLNGEIAANAVKQEPYTTINTANHITLEPCVKAEPEWETADGRETEVVCADRKVKQELLESEELPSYDILKGLHLINNEIFKKELKNAAMDSPKNRKNIKIYKQGAMSMGHSEIENKPLFEKKSVNSGIVDAQKLSSEITKPSQVRLRSRLLIQYEDDPYTEENIPKSVKKRKIHKCEHCGKCFSYRPVLTNHIRIHTGEKPYSCKICSKQFSDYAVLIRHRRVHTGERPHTCDICGKSYSEKYLLKNHKLTHTGGATYFCKDCPKTFVNSSNYKRHQQVHMHKYTCDLCKKKFGKKAALTSHIINHTKPRPHACDFCDKEFTISAHLKRHLAIHMGSNEVYTCGLCKKEFTQLGSLQRHVSRKVCQKQIGGKS